MKTIVINSTERKNASLPQVAPASHGKGISTSGKTDKSLLAGLFSAVLEEDVTPHQAACLLNAIMALLVTVFAMAMPMLFRVLCFAWFATALWQCKRAGLGDDNEDE